MYPLTNYSNIDPENNQVLVSGRIYVDLLEGI